MRRLPAILLLGCLAGAGVGLGGYALACPAAAAGDGAAADSRPCSDGPRELLRLDAPGGRIDVGGAVGGLATAIGLQAPPLREINLDLVPLLRAVGLTGLAEATDGLLDFRVGDEGISLHWDGSVIARNWDSAAGTLTNWWSAGVRQLAAMPRWTVEFLDGTSGEPAPMPAGGEIPEEVVVLVHGLDEPGWIWDDLGPALREAGHCPAAVNYPNDGSISTSADCLGAALTSLRARGVRRVDVVAHSMGGLVVRDVLTRPHWYDGCGHGHAALPDVERVILVGTPNRGAAVATLQPLSELKDQAVRLARGTWQPDGDLSDGRGEAAIDLHPDSAFLAALNARGLPEGVQFTVIAGSLAGGVGADLLQRAEAGVRTNETEGVPAPAPGSPRAIALRAVAQARAAAGEAALLGARTIGNLDAWLGDGLVTIESAMLEGVEDTVVVAGNHQSILRSWRRGTTPPAVPIVLDRLERRPQRDARAATPPQPEPAVR